jgi:hypothetical protein
MNARATPTGNQQLFASIANFADTGRTFGAELSIDGRLIDARNVEIAANDRRALVFDSLPPGGGLASLKIDLADDLAADNLAWCFVSSSRLIRVGVASTNSFLLGALAVNSALEARRAETASASALSAFDCLVSDSLIPSGFLESGRPLLLINPSDAPGISKAVGQLEQPQVGSVTRSHPINAYLNFAEMNLERATRIEPASWLQPILTTAGGDGLIWAGDDGRRRIVLIGFDPGWSDLPLQVEFPILMANVVSWLSGDDPAAAGRVVRPGQATLIPATSSSATVTTPDGRTDKVTAIDSAQNDGSIVYANTMRTGIYEIEGGIPFAVTLLSESESDTGPRDRIQTQRGDVLSNDQTYTSEREIWSWMAAAALLLLGAEWWTFHRRVL